MLYMVAFVAGLGLLFLIMVMRVSFRLTHRERNEHLIRARDCERNNERRQLNSRKKTEENGTV